MLLYRVSHRRDGIEARNYYSRDPRNGDPARRIERLMDSDRAIKICAKTPGQGDRVVYDRLGSFIRRNMNKDIFQHIATLRRR
jgi:hypothetical protein